MKLLTAHRVLVAMIVGLGCHPLLGHAQTIDFDNLTPNLYMPDDSFVDSGFKLTVVDSFAQVDKADAVSVPTRGNDSQFYFQAGDGGLLVQREDEASFDLSSFSVAATPLVNAAGEPTVMVAFATYMDNTYFGKTFDFAPAVDGAYPFATLLGGTELMGLRSVLFFVCANDIGGGGVCFGSTRGNGQFAIDDIRLNGLNVAPVPEPAVVVLMAAGLLALAWRARARSTSNANTGSLA